MILPFPSNVSNHGESEAFYPVTMHKKGHTR